jgi:hypothetical protein
MPKLDPFTRRRLQKFLLDFRQNKGQLPVLSDCEKAGFDKTTMDQAVKEKLAGEFYVTLTTGAIVKGYKAIAE